jgi:CheY-like chemotaxis protein
LRDPVRNRSTAFTHAQRAKLALAGLLPPGVQTLEQQAVRAYAQFVGQPTPLAQNTFLEGLQDRNVTFPASRNVHCRLPGDAGDMTLRCLIVDDSRRFLDAARHLLERQGITVVGEASTSAEALRLAVELEPDVTLLDIDLGGESGCELARRLSRETNTALSRMILISTHAEQDYADLIAASPAIGFVSKSTLSAGAIRDLLGSQRDRDPSDLGPVPQIVGGDHDAGIHQDPRDRP